MNDGPMLRPVPCERSASVSQDGDRTLTRWLWLIEFMGGVTNRISNGEITNKKLINRMLNMPLTQVPQVDMTEQGVLSSGPNLQ